MARLLRPSDDVVDVQGVGQDRFDERMPVKLHLAGKGRDYPGATLATTVDDDPATGAVLPLKNYRRYVVVNAHLAAFAEVQLSLEFCHCFPGHGPATVTRGAHRAPYTDDVGVYAGQFVQIADFQVAG